MLITPGHKEKGFWVIILCFTCGIFDKMYCKVSYHDHRYTVHYGNESQQQQPTLL